MTMSMMYTVLTLMCPPLHLQDGTLHFIVPKRDVPGSRVLSIK